MTVYFVYRCPYIGKTCKHIKTFPDATVLDWFRRHWKALHEGPSEWADELVGVDVYSFGHLNRKDIYEDAETPPLPTTIEDAAAALQSCYQNAIYWEEHAIQVETDDDELDMAYYFLDDVFCEEHPELTSFLLYSEQFLPDRAGPGGWKPDASIRQRILDQRGPANGVGRTYMVEIDLHQVEALEDIDCDSVYVLENMRIPDIARFILREDFGEHPEPYHMCYLQETLRTHAELDPHDEKGFLKLIRTETENDGHWGIYSDWLQEHGKRPVEYYLLERGLQLIDCTNGKPTIPNEVFVGDHIFHLYLHQGQNDFEQWIVFDDVWASAHPNLAHSLVKFTTHWDVLSTGKETRWE